MLKNKKLKGVKKKAELLELQKLEQLQENLQMNGNIKEASLRSISLEKDFLPSPFIPSLTVSRLCVSFLCEIDVSTGPKQIRLSHLSRDGRRLHFACDSHLLNYIVKAERFVKEEVHLFSSP